MDNKLKFSNHVETAVSKANKILGLTKRTLTYMDDDNLSLIGADLPGAVGANAPKGKGSVGACTQRKN